MFFRFIISAFSFYSFTFPFSLLYSFNSVLTHQHVNSFVFGSLAFSFCFIAYESFVNPFLRFRYFVQFCFVVLQHALFFTFAISFCHPNMSVPSLWLFASLFFHFCSVTPAPLRRFRVKFRKTKIPLIEKLT